RLQGGRRGRGAGRVREVARRGPGRDRQSRCLADARVRAAVPEHARIGPAGADRLRRVLAARAGPGRRHGVPGAGGRAGVQPVHGVPAAARAAGAQGTGGVPAPRHLPAATRRGRRHHRRAGGGRRKLVSRARANIGRPVARQHVPPRRQASLLEAFRHAVATGQTALLAGMLAEDVVLAADGGGKVAAIATPVCGRAMVLEFIAARLSAWWRAYAWEDATINGARGALLTSDGRLEAAVSFSYDGEGRATGVYI